VGLLLKSDYGEIVIDVLDLNGDRIARSKAIQSDSLDAQVDWETGNLDDVRQPVILKIMLTNALLFAFWCS
jgi:hypothetical protein